VRDLAESLRSGRVSPKDVPPIRLVERDGFLIGLDNRRLQAFQLARVPVPYRMATPREIASESWKFATPHGVVSVRIRGGGS
jgi:hypothetical protein